MSEFILGTGRVLVGFSIIVSPGVTGRVFGIGHSGYHNHTALIMRMFGIRDFVGGAALLYFTYNTPIPLVRQTILASSVFMDSVDFCSFLIVKYNEKYHSGEPLDWHGNWMMGGSIAFFIGL
eukprot:Pgem_evm1s15938